MPSQNVLGARLDIAKKALVEICGLSHLADRQLAITSMLKAAEDALRKLDR